MEGQMETQVFQVVAKKQRKEDVYFAQGYTTGTIPISRKYWCQDEQSILQCRSRCCMLMVIQMLQTMHILVPPSSAECINFSTSFFWCFHVLLQSHYIAYLRF